VTEGENVVLLGTTVNALTIIVGTLIGKLLSKIPENMKNTVMKGIGLTVIVLGMQMAIKSNNFLIVILSIVFGAMLGEFIDLDKMLNRLGKWIERKINLKGEGNISQGFVTATLIFVIGAMAIVGALDSGIRGNHDVLFTKAIIDGFTAIILTTTLGIGVIFSSISVFLYQGLIAIFANQINLFVPQELMDSFITEMTSVGGIMILAIGLNLSNISNIRVANLLPGILVVAIIVTLMYFIP
jgi:uncharacterized protein